MPNSKPLKIYKASAGSGKTYTLTLNYLKLLFKRGGGTTRAEYNRVYSKILAVTFTNKATDEMKSRIIESLYKISNYTPNNPNAPYIDELINAGAASTKEELAKRAKEILCTLVHDYTNFNISTIDTFFQRTMRVFARDLGLQGGYNVEIEPDRILDEAVDRMYQSLHDNEKSDLSIWLQEFDKEIIDRGDNWNASERSIRELSKELFKESYKAWRNSIPDGELIERKAIKSYKDTLMGKVKGFEDEYMSICKQGRVILKDIDTAELCGKSRTPFNIFNNIKFPIQPLTATFISLVEKEDKWLQPNASAGASAAIAELKKNECVERIIALFDTKYKEYIVAKKIAQKIYTFGILNDIDAHIQSIQSERNLMLLSDTAELLNKIIDGSDAPFIYERTGVQIDHFMIDEFQDTSAMQWDNFKPLIENSVSNGDENLIVGDVKQSIYRWRNSDWRLLNNLTSPQNNSVQGTHEVLTLDTNWRSAKDVVEFNNRFFVSAMGLVSNAINLAEETPLNTAYSDVVQKLPCCAKDDSGYVEVNIITRDNKDAFREAALESMYKGLVKLINGGCQAEDITILVRAKSEASLVASYLIKEQAKDCSVEFNIISDEALLIQNSPSVRLLIAILKCIKSPNNKTLRIIANYESAVIKGYTQSSALTSAISPSGDAPQFSDERIEYYKKRPLFEMCEELISEFITDKDIIAQTPYIQAFQDAVLNFTRRYSSNLSLFLDWWDKNSSKAVITPPPNQNAIRIMTVHKSKGLEFKTVIIPFADWKMGIGNDTIAWCDPVIDPAPNIKVPLTLSSSMAETPYEDIYKEELMLTLADSLNIAYVAFTRAKSNLILYTYSKESKGKESKDKKSKSYGNFAALLIDTIYSFGDFKLQPDKSDCNSNIETLSWGTLQTPTFSPAQQEEPTLPTYQIIKLGDRLKVNLQGSNYFKNRDKILYGEIMHRVLSSIVTADDLLPKVKYYKDRGEITEAEGDALVATISAQLCDPTIASWFSPDAKVLNEVVIIDVGGEQHRPDRVIDMGDRVVVVDYKFGEPNRKYHKQVVEYMGLIRRMGYFDILGYIWYINSSLVEVV